MLLTILFKARSIPWPIRTKFYWIFAFLYGLSAGIHAAMALFVPAFLGFIGLTEPRAFRIKNLAYLAFFFLLGFAIYLYLPIRSLTEPAFDWGDPETFRQFLIQLLDRKDDSVYTGFPWPKLPYLLHRYLGYLLNEFAMLGAALSLLGFVSAWKRDKCMNIMLTLAFIGYNAFFILIGWSVAWGFIPSFVICSLWVGFGMRTSLVGTASLYQHYCPRIPRTALNACLCGGIVVTLGQTVVRHLPQTYRTDNYSAELYGRELLEQLPPDAILFCEYAWFPLLYLQQVEKRRPDLTFILQGEILFPQYFALPSKRRFPNRVVPQ